MFSEYIPHDYILKELDNRWNEILPHLLMYNNSVSEEEKNLISDAIRNFYFEKEAVSTETIDPLIQVKLPFYTKKIAVTHIISSPFQIF